MQKVVQTDRSYTITYYATATKDRGGVSVTVAGDVRRKVEREAREMYRSSLLNVRDVESEVKGGTADVQMCNQNGTSGKAES